MIPASRDGFRFEWSRRDLSSAEGMRKVQYLVIATSLEEAFAVMAGQVGTRHGVRLLKRGQTVLDEAVNLGIGDGEARAL